MKIDVNKLCDSKAMIPVVILNGFLGSGKTTLLRDLLVQSHKKEISVCIVVNEMSELDIDGELVSDTDVIGRNKGNFESIYSDVLSSKTGISKLNKVLAKMLLKQQPDLVIIETSGSSHPLPLVEYFRSHQKLSLTGMLTLADSAMLANDFDCGKQLVPQLQYNLQHNKRNTINLLAEQIMFCSHLFLTKADKLKNGELESIANSIHQLNPYVDVISVPWGQFSVDKVLAMPQYNFNRVAQLINELKPVLESEEHKKQHYNIESRVIKDERPFHPERLWETCSQYLGQNIYRSKGFFWLASRDKISLLWSQTAGSINLELVGYWRSGIVEEKDNGLHEMEIALLKEKLAREKGRFGDRHCQLTVIGDKTQVDSFTEALKACFLTEEEIKHWQSGGEFTDPWPKNMVKIKN